jgi:hypothetical protein
MGWFKVAQVIGSKVVLPTIKKFKPFTKFKGQKTVTQVRNDASVARIKQATFDYKEGVKKALKKMKDIK